MLGLDVDGGQDAVLAHAGEQPQSADSCPGAHLDHGSASGKPGEQAQQRPDGGRHRARPGQRRAGQRLAAKRRQSAANLRHTAGNRR